jgi:hypothetical protein
MQSDELLIIPKLSKNQSAMLTQSLIGQLHDPLLRQFRHQPHEDKLNDAIQKMSITITITQNIQDLLHLFDPPRPATNTPIATPSEIHILHGGRDEGEDRLGAAATHAQLFLRLWKAACGGRGVLGEERRAGCA